MLIYISAFRYSLASLAPCEPLCEGLTQRRSKSFRLADPCKRPDAQSSLKNLAAASHANGSDLARHSNSSLDAGLGCPTPRIGRGECHHEPGKRLAPSRK